MYIALSVCTVLIIGNFVPTFIPNIIFGQQTIQDFEIMKIKKEIELLGSQVNHTKIQIASEFSPPNIFLPVLGALLSAIAIALIPAFFAWRHERNKIPTVEQEKIINDIATKWYYNRHLCVYNEIWDKIEAFKDNAQQQKEVDKFWKYLCVKQFPIHDYNGIDGFKAVEVQDQITKYIARRLNIKKGVLRSKKRYLKEEKELKDRLKIIVDESSVSYYDSVRETLPGVAQYAVLATLGEEHYTDNDYKEVYNKSLMKLKRMMVFYRLREDKKVAEIILRSAVYTNLRDANKIRPS